MWPKPTVTQDLLLEVRDGNSKAVDQLFTRHRPAVEKLIQLRLDQQIRQREGVSDILQDVFVEANRRLDKYLENPKIDFHLWLRQIAKDRMIDAYRRHRKSEKRNIDRQRSFNAPEESSILLADQLMDPSITPAAAIAKKEIAQIVEQAISSLPEQDYEILVMRHYEQLSNQEVASALNLTAPAASMRYLRAIEKLKKVLSSSVDLPGS